MVRGHNAKTWKGLVDYANAPDLDNPEALNNLAGILFESMPWMARTAVEEDVPAMIALRVTPELLFDNQRRWMSFTTRETLENEFRRQAAEYQPRVRQLLRWLADRKRNAQDQAHVFAFLIEHMKHIEFKHGDPAFASEEKELQFFTSGGNLKDEADFPFRTSSYKDVADVICDFIYKEYEPGRGLPLRLCSRPGCGNPVTKLKKRQYCRTTICDRERTKRDSDLKQQKNRDSVFLSRLKKMPGALRRKKTRKTETMQRLRQIGNDWRGRNQRLADYASKFLKEAGVN